MGGYRGHAASSLLCSDEDILTGRALRAIETLSDSSALEARRFSTLEVPYYFASITSTRLHNYL